MAKIAHPTRRSEKKVIDLSLLTGDKRFILPREIANDCDPDTLKPSVVVTINGKRTFIPVGEPVAISYENFCTLKDAGILGPGHFYCVNAEFDPLNP